MRLFVRISVVVASRQAIVFVSWTYLINICIDGRMSCPFLAKAKQLLEPSFFGCIVNLLVYLWRSLLVSRLGNSKAKAYW